jgi:hypothetical protein
MSGDAVAVAWDSWVPRPLPESNAQIVAGFRGEQHGQRYFFARWENMDYSEYYDKPLLTFEGRLYEDGRVQVHYLKGDFSIGDVFSGAQCDGGMTGFTIPKDKMVAGKKITLTPHYRLHPLTNNVADDGIMDTWKLLYKINPHDTYAVNMVFNDKGLTLRQCFEKRYNPWTGLPPNP